MRTVEHICFDKDGTLIDVHIYWSDIILKRARRITTQYNLPQPAVGDLCKAMGVDPAIQRILPKGPVGYKPRAVIIEAARSVLSRWNVEVEPEDIAEVFVDIDKWMQENASYEIRVFSDVRSSLEQLRQAGFKLSIYTSDRRENLNRTMGMLGLTGYFDALVGGDDVKSSKPHPEGFLIACERVGIKPDQTAYVGDTVDDMYMGKEANASICVGVTTGLDSAASLKICASYVVDGLSQLPSLLMKGV